MKEKARTSTRRPTGPDITQVAPEERAWRLAQLAAILAPKTFVTAEASDGHTLQLIQARSPDRSLLETFNRETAFEVVLLQADYLLKAAERIARVQHAYQLFRLEDQFLTKESIAKVFRAHNWRNLTSPQSVDALMASILRGLREIRPIHAELSSVLPQAASYPQVEEHPAWVPPDDLYQGPKQTKDLKGKPVKRPGCYWAERILLLAHLALREKFKAQIERNLEFNH